tara:strand:+ start:175 stop:537 length:363 start_codon:yes stop_codon:yes gene_type:complete
MAVNTFPHSLEAEEAVIGSILLKGNEIYTKCNGWIRDSDAFYNGDLKTIWKAFTIMHRDGESIDTITLTQHLRDKDLINNKTNLTVYYITGLAEAVPSISNVESYSRIIWEKYLLPYILL